MKNVEDSFQKPKRTNSNVHNPKIFSILSKRSKEIRIIHIKKLESVNFVHFVVRDYSNLMIDG